MAGESNFSLQIANLVGGATIDQEFCDDAATDACKEIINQLPAKLKAKCASRTSITNLNGTDLDSKGDILHVTRLSADSGGYEKACREIPAMYGDLTNDSTDLNYYATVGDPIYFITNNASGNPTLFVRPNPTSAQPSYVHHISYPTVDVSADTLEIANFPDEATYLVVLFAATRQLLKFQAEMTTSWQADITTAIDAVNTALDRVASYNWGDADTFDTAAAQLTRVKNALNNAENVINGNQPSTTTDAFGALANEDTEIVASALSVAGTELSRAQAHLGEWSSIGGMAIQEANGFIAEASSRLQLETTKYQWYGDQYAKLSAEYARGLAGLKGGGAQ